MTASGRLLLLDDDEAFCEGLARTLRRRGFEVATANDLSTGLQAAQTLQPQFAVIDLRIGAESGLTMVQRLHELNPDIKTVMLTGFASIATAVEAIKLGATQYLTKPAQVDEIVAAFDMQDGNPHAAPAEDPMSVRRLEWEHLQRVLQEHDGNISAAARSLNMHRRTLQRKLQKRPVKQ